MTPKPDGQRARRNRTVGMTPLPAAGRKGRTPRWPLVPDVSTVTKLEAAERAVERYEQLAENATTAAKKRTALANVEKSQLRVAEFQAMIAAQAEIETELWRDLWKTPQATQWEKLKFTRDIAMYVRHKARAEIGSVEDAKEARQWADRLGLTPLSLLRLRWEIVDGPTSGSAPSGRPKSMDRYSHLRVVAETSLNLDGSTSTFRRPGTKPEETV